MIFLKQCLKELNTFVIGAITADFFLIYHYEHRLDKIDLVMFIVLLMLVIAYVALSTRIESQK